MRELCPALGAIEVNTLEAGAWYALSAKHQHEQAVRGALEFQGWEALAPTYRARRQWSDRVKQLDLPLFPGYVFCCFPLARRSNVLAMPGVTKLVSFGGVPAEIAGAEIAAIQKAAQSGLPLAPWLRLAPGDKVRVERGPLKGVEGTLLRKKGGFRLVIGVEMLQRWMTVELEPDMVMPERGLRRAS